MKLPDNDYQKVNPLDNRKYSDSCGTCGKAMEPLDDFAGHLDRACPLCIRKMTEGVDFISIPELIAREITREQKARMVYAEGICAFNHIKPRSFKQTVKYLRAKHDKIKPTAKPAHQSIDEYINAGGMVSHISQGGKRERPIVESVTFIIL